MDANENDLMACLGVLRAVLVAKSRGEGNLSKIKVMVVPEFDMHSVDWDVVDCGQINEATTNGDQLVVRFLSSSVAYPYRATFRRSGNEEWRLAKFEGACPACFADGVLDGKTCYICDGLGYHAD